MKKLAYFFVGALLSLTILAVACKHSGTANHNSRKEVRLSDYLTVNFSGYDTFGEATATIDFRSMVENNPTAFDIDKVDDSEYDRSVKSAILMSQDIFIGKLDKASRLSNGDTINFIWDDSMKASIVEFSGKFDFSSASIKVEGLLQAEQFDPFESIDVIFTGISPFGCANWNSRSEDLFGLRFVFDKNSNLSNGDTVTLTLSDADMSEWCAAKGKIPSARCKTYTVEGLSSFIKTIDEIPNAVLARIEQQGIDNQKAYSAKTWVEPGSLKSMEPIGCYLLTPKDYVSHNEAENILYVVYRLTVSNSDNNGTPFSYYEYATLSDLVLNADDTISLYASGNLVGFDLRNLKMTDDKEHFDYGSYWYVGYLSLDELFNKTVMVYIDRYNYESSVSE